jgi:hypothetical protein
MPKFLSRISKDFDALLQLDSYFKSYNNYCDYFMKNIYTKFIVFIVFLLIVILSSSCAAQHKYKKYKPIPCPCEKDNKR